MYWLLCLMIAAETINCRNSHHSASSQATRQRFVQYAKLKKAPERGILYQGKSTDTNLRTSLIQKFCTGKFFFLPSRYKSLKEEIKYFKMKEVNFSSTGNLPDKSKEMFWTVLNNYSCKTMTSPGKYFIQKEGKKRYNAISHLIYLVTSTTVNSKSQSIHRPSQISNALSSPVIYTSIKHSWSPQTLMYNACPACNLAYKTYVVECDIHFNVYILK